MKRLVHTLFSCYALLFLSLSFIAFQSCKKENDPAKIIELPYTIPIPAGFPPLIFPNDNKPTQLRVELGRKLYYDPILSNDGRACASCHIQSLGFAIGMAGGVNVLPHINLGWNRNFMWNGSKTGQLEEIMLFEVNDFFATDLQKINQSEVYKNLFKEAYGKNTITDKDIAYALAQFFRTLNSANSKFDKYLQQKANLTASETMGMYIFFSEKGDCYHCHREIFFTNNNFSNIGLDSTFEPGTRGRYEVTKEAQDIGKFKIPTLRNVALRPHFMHDGRFKTLAEVIEFYHSGVKINSPNIDAYMVTPDKIYGQRFTETEKGNLIDFLHTLTDSVFITNTTLAKPQ